MLALAEDSLKSGEDESGVMQKRFQAGNARLFFGQIVNDLAQLSDREQSAGPPSA